MNETEEYLRSRKSVEHGKNDELEESLRVVRGINDRYERSIAQAEATANVQRLRTVENNTVQMSEGILLEGKEK